MNMASKLFIALMIACALFDTVLALFAYVVPQYFPDLQFLQFLNNQTINRLSPYILLIIAVSGVISGVGLGVERYKRLHPKIHVTYDRFNFSNLKTTDTPTPIKHRYVRVQNSSGQWVEPEIPIGFFRTTKGKIVIAFFVALVLFASYFIIFAK